ncbi:MAG: hypothetical protein AB7F31_03990 [Parachlamydiales bacterium]
MFSRMFRRICLTSCILLTLGAAAMPAKAEARGGAGVAVAAGAGGLIGGLIIADMAHHNKGHCKQKRCVAIQQQTMRYVLNNYNPAFHEAWVQYVIVDCCGTLTPVQQHQLLGIMDQKRAQLGHPVCCLPR